MASYPVPVGGGGGQTVMGQPVMGTPAVYGGAPPPLAGAPPGYAPPPQVQHVHVIAQTLPDFLAGVCQVCPAQAHPEGSVAGRCLSAFFCTPCMAGRLVEMFRPMEGGVMCAGNCGGACCLHCLGSFVPGIMMMAGCLLLGCPCCMFVGYAVRLSVPWRVQTRLSTRRKYGLRDSGTGCSDCCNIYFCEPCTIIQELHQHEMSGGMRATLLKGGMQNRVGSGAGGAGGGGGGVQMAQIQPPQGQQMLGGPPPASPGQGPGPGPAWGGPPPPVQQAWGSGEASSSSAPPAPVYAAPPPMAPPSKG